MGKNSRNLLRPLNVFLALVLFLSLFSPSQTSSADPEPGTTLWAKSTEEAPTRSDFTAVATDTSGNSYAVGEILAGEFNFGNGVTATGVHDASGEGNAVIVKYNSSGVAQWARSPIVAPKVSIFKGVALDSFGNVYVAGWICSHNEFDFGNGVTATSAYDDAAQCGVVIVKYNSSGVAQWASSTESAVAGSAFYAIAIDSSNNIYCAGLASGKIEFDFGNGVTVTGGGNGFNSLLVKYNTAGEAQWAKSIVTSPLYTYFTGVGVDGLGNIFGTGPMYTNSEYDFGNGATVTGGYNFENPVIVKYNSSGNTQWARSTVTSTTDSSFTSVTGDALGNSYAAGYLRGNKEYDFGNGVTASSTGATYSPIIIKYNSAGLAQWANSTPVAPNHSVFNAIVADGLGNFYAAGHILGTSEYDFGDDVVASGGGQFYNPIIVKYTSSGDVVWAKSATAAPSSSDYFGISTDGSGNIFAVGTIYGSDEYDFNNDIAVSGAFANHTNTVIVKYSDSNSSGDDDPIPDPDPDNDDTDPNTDPINIGPVTYNNSDSDTNNVDPTLYLTELPRTGRSNENNY